MSARYLHIAAAKLGLTWILFFSCVGCSGRPDASQSSVDPRIGQNLIEKKEKVRVACIGDSITYGDGTQPLEGPYGNNEVLV